MNTEIKKTVEAIAATNARNARRTSGLDRGTLAAGKERTKKWNI